MKLLALSLVSIAAFAQVSGSASEIELVPVQGNVYLLAGAGGNITVQAGKDGLLLVDTGLDIYADRVFGEIAKLSPRPLRFIIDSSPLAEHSGANEKLAKRGSTIAAGNLVIPVG